MNAPTWAALAPGVFVSGRMVSATSSRKPMSWAVNLPIRRVSALLGGVPLARGEQRAAADERDPTEQGADAPDRLAAIDQAGLSCLRRHVPSVWLQVAALE